MSPFEPFRGGGSPKGDNVPFFYRFFFMRASLRPIFLLSMARKKSDKLQFCGSNHKKKPMLDNEQFLVNFYISTSVQLFSFAWYLKAQTRSKFNVSRQKISSLTFCKQVTSTFNARNYCRKPLSTEPPNGRDSCMGKFQKKKNQNRKFEKFFKNICHHCIL